MPTYEFNLPEGRTISGQGASPEEAWQSLRKQQTQPATTAAAPKTVADPTFEQVASPFGRRVREIGRGAIQGAVLDPLEAVGQATEFGMRHTTGGRLPVPEVVRKGLREVQKDVESTTTGQVSRLGGAVGSLAFGPEGLFGLARALMAARAARAARAVQAARTIGGVGGIGRLATPEEIATVAGGTRAVRQAGKTENVLAETRQLEAGAKALGKPVGELTDAETAAIFSGEPAAAPAAARTGPGLARRAAGGAAGATLQPVEAKDDTDYLAQKGVQALGGGALGALASRASRAAGAGGGARVGVSHHGWPYVAIGGMSIPLYWMLHHPGIFAATLGALAAAATGRGAARVVGRGGPRAIRGAGAAIGQGVEDLGAETRNGQETE